MTDVHGLRAYGGGLIADGPDGCVGRCTCGWRSEHSKTNGPALKALVEHLTKGEHLSPDSAEASQENS